MTVFFAVYYLSNKLFNLDLASRPYLCNFIGTAFKYRYAFKYCYFSSDDAISSVVSNCFESGIATHPQKLSQIIIMNLVIEKNVKVLSFCRQAVN